MLPKFYTQACRSFLEVLLSFQKQLNAEYMNMIAIKTGYQQVKQVFQAEIMELTVDELDASAIAVWQSAQTEIHRRLRLLETEILFLRSARQVETAKQRLDKINTCLEQLIADCQKLVDLGD